MESINQKNFFEEFKTYINNLTDEDFVKSAMTIIGKDVVEEENDFVNLIPASEIVKVSNAHNKSNADKILKYINNKIVDAANDGFYEINIQYTTDDKKDYDMTVIPRLRAAGYKTSILSICGGSAYTLYISWFPGWID